MLLQEKMKNLKFSHSERNVLDFIIKKQELIDEYSTTMIAGETFTSPSILVRISKKLGFNGWNELKKAFLKEVGYLKTNFKDLDANTPFTHQDSIMNIASKITHIHIESAKDTLSLINHDSLQKSVRILSESREVKVFTISNLTFLGQEFVYKLRHIGKKADTNPTESMMYQEAVMTSSSDCAICISYSGESSSLLETVHYLKMNQVPIIAITSIGENSLARLADVTLHVTTREKSYSKIAGFASIESISLILDILYSCLFSIKYDNNYDFKVKLAQQTESRQIKNQIIQEEEN
ncbi:MurR/RpiR family transcriptional regulator [Niallia nealsonii]|uniref:MurR/RpiR family transcriptional regulator n=1 Tax=Niallia nealsonii TaxID=115979 RepID=A0A2N0YZI9_9BACI|nr:MurR/RpiR family transcriptional regulator [Niallia nealsonii]PKG22680.1 MurR/RpiR family transcriptional regulator [Niallia nealsonii]